MSKIESAYKEMMEDVQMSGSMIAYCMKDKALELERELTTATEQLTKAHETIGTMIDEIGMLQLKDKATTEQRDRLAAALTKIQGVGLVAVDAFDELDIIDEIVDEALQSLDPNDERMDG
jgi:hypothetical protein